MPTVIGSVINEREPPIRIDLLDRGLKKYM
jgi:hypothetical protein